MNQLLAVLKDSYREAVNTWVIPVMLVLSALLMLFVASVSFRPISLKDALDRDFGTFNWAFGFDPNAKGTAFAVENFSGTNDAEPWKADYMFDIVFRTPDRKLLANVKQNVAFPVTRRRAENFVRKEFPQIAEVTAEDISPPNPDARAEPPGPVELRFRVRTKGTTVDDRRAWFHMLGVLFAFELPIPTTLRDGVYTLEKRLVNDVGAWVLLLVSVVVTAGFVPDMLRKGAADLLIAKPIGRGRLLAYKYLGGLIFVFILTAVTVGGVWAVVGVRTGLWSPNFLALIPVLTFYFAVLYAVSVLSAVLTRSTLVAILATLVAWAVFFGVGWGNHQLDSLVKMDAELRAKMEEAARGGGAGEEQDVPRPPSPDSLWKPHPALDYTVRGLYAVLPRAYDLDDRMIRLIAEGVLTDAELKARKMTDPLPPWWATLGVSAAFIAVVLGLAAWRFSTRDG